MVHAAKLTFGHILTSHSGSPTISLQTRNLSCSRNDRQLFDDLNLDVEAGHMLLVEGANGSGKTSLLRILTGFRLPDEGEVLWQGKSIRKLGGDYYEQVNYVGHHDGNKLELSCLENLRLAQAMGVPAEIDLDDVLERVNLYAYGETEVGNMSAGQRRRLALARLIATASPQVSAGWTFTSITPGSGVTLMTLRLVSWGGG